MNSCFDGATRKASSGTVRDQNSSFEFTHNPFFSFSNKFGLEGLTEYSLGRLYLVSRYIDLENTGVKSVEEIQRSQTSSIHSIESQIELLARMITDRSLEEQEGEVTMLSTKELEITAHIIRNEEKIDSVSEESTFPEEEEA
ncbi:hypothetical protein M9H77_18872 [Catharanthus roseus]|uniref:Uncharacterized protein n=1 Tax=Catharanthus roseus TaxID=4058 RepID=A0ACC0B8M2_CATRO|nr:hypothetical protein M9H77_18872 [Catharanthus roseus]